MLTEKLPPTTLGVPKVEIRNLQSHSKGRQFWNSFSEPNPSKPADQEFSLDKLDLIFKREPKQIQSKLVQLLLRYNARMQYNRTSDMFEVDMLIPFENQEQKRQFIRQFLEIRRQKGAEFTGNILGTQEQEKKQEIQWIGEYKQIRKFSFNNGGNQEAGDDSNNAGARDDRERAGSGEAIRGGNGQEEQRIDLTGKFREILLPLEPKKEKVDLQTLDEIISRRLKVAIDIIRSQQKMEASQSSYHEANTIYSNDLPKEDSIIDQISNSISLGSTEKIGEQKLLNISGCLKDQIKPQSHPPPHLPNSRQDYAQHRKANEFSYLTEKPHYHEITQEAEQDEYEPLFNQEIHQLKPNLDSKVTAFEEYAKKYASIKQSKQQKVKVKPPVSNKRYPQTQKNYKEKKTQVPLNYHSQRNAGKNISINITAQQRNTPKTNLWVKKSDAKVANREKSLSKNKKDLEESRRDSDKKIDVFFQTYRKSLDQLYADVMQRIQKNAPLMPSSNSSLQKSLDDFYILVLDDEATQEQLPVISEQVESSTFKEEIMREYQREILILNRNLSSEDLVSYFKYLHTNAKKLYLRYLKNKVK